MSTQDPKEPSPWSTQGARREFGSQMCTGRDPRSQVQAAAEGVWRALRPSDWLWGRGVKQSEWWTDGWEALDKPRGRSGCSV